MEQRYTRLFEGKRILTFLGEAGSGKTEIALNVALGLATETNQTIHFFDMDQSKPLFRARDAVAQVQAAGVVFHSNTDTSIEDVAAIAPGVLAALREKESYVIFDIGGGERGARMVGQFFQDLNSPDSLIICPVNPYRPWSGSMEELGPGLEALKAAARTQDICIFSNPNLCWETTAEDVLVGHQQLLDVLQGRYKVSCICALEPLCAALEGRLEVPILPLNIQILYPWKK